MAKKNIILTGATGMVGKGVLLECLDSPEIGSVLSVGRSSLGIDHPKLKEALVKDFLDLSSIESELKGYDAAFFCMGVSAGGMKEADYRRITKEYTLNFARTVLEQNENCVFCYVSGAGTDSSEKGSSMWARVKGETENALLALPFKKAVMFRPGLIQPKRGIKSKTASYNAIYFVLKPFWPIMHGLFGKNITDTDKIGKAMIRILGEGKHKTHLENQDINALAAS